MENDTLGNRMKIYEGAEAMRKLMPLLPIMVRLDGKAFHTFTKDLNRPYDTRFQQLMFETTMCLVKETNAVLGYTQSDEISLVIIPQIKSEPYFGGRIQKICSTLSAVCSVHFNSKLKDYLPEKADQFPTFDCRVWNVPNLNEAANTILWRELDAAKNSISMAAQCYFSHKSLHGLDGKQKQEKLFQEKGINWDEYPARFKHGSFIKRVKVSTPFSKQELEELPPKHDAHKNPDLIITRSRYLEVEFPKLSSIENLPEALFEDAKPIIRI